MVKKKISKKKFDLGKLYRESWLYLKETKVFIWIIVGLFFLFFLVGLFVPAPEFVSDKIFEFIVEVLEKTEGMSQSGLTSFIFFNNLQAGFLGTLLGVFFGIFPIFFTIFNGYLVGFVSSLAIQAEGVGSLWRLVPHGIFELPAIFISFALGLRLGVCFFDQKKFGRIKENLINCLKVFLLFVVPLLVVAAIIEGALIFLG